MSGKGPNSKLNQSYIKYSLVKSNARKKCEVKRQLIANLNEFFSHGKKKVVRRVGSRGLVRGLYLGQSDYDDVSVYI